ncbi:Alpha/Beta hydrolase fold [Rhypophila decipiens]
MVDLWTRWPGKTGAYCLYFVATTILCLPWYMVSYLLPQRRPNQKWSYRQAVCRFLALSFLDLAAAIELKVPTRKNHPDPAGKNKRSSQTSVTTVEIPAGPDHVYLDILRCDAGINPTSIAGVWFPRPPSETDLSTRSSSTGPVDDDSSNRGGQRRSRRVILHFHGGAYLLGSAHDPDFRHAMNSTLRLFGLAQPNDKKAKKEGKEDQVWAFCPEYRLSSVTTQNQNLTSSASISSSNRFPAAFQDAVTAYYYLTCVLEFYPSEIVLSGDSAGAHLALGLLRYISTHGSLFSHKHNNINTDPPASPVLAGCLLWSPWPDMALTVEESLHRPAVKVDYIPPRFISWAHREFLPSPEALSNIKGGRANPYLSPNRAGIETKTPIWIQWGGSEVLKPEIERLVLEQTKVHEGGGGRLGVCEVLDAPHDIWLTSWVLGWEKEKERATKEALRFLDGGNDWLEG